MFRKTAAIQTTRITVNGMTTSRFNGRSRLSAITFTLWFDLADSIFAINLPASHESVPITHLDLNPIDYATPHLQRTLKDRGKSF